MYKPSKIFVESIVQNNKITQKILGHFKGLPVIILDEVNNEKEKINTDSTINTEAKKNLLIAKNKGFSIKPCPCAKEVMCCNYSIMNLYTNCYLECTYCILQSYLNNPYLTIYANIDEQLNETKKVLKENPDTIYRIGTGELSDSLALDHITGFSKTLVSFFARQKNAVLELKTKTNNINHLIGLEHQNKTIISWSVNPEKIIKEEEFKTSSLDERLEAAVLCQKSGYSIGFHFDPIVYYDGWQEDYKNLIKQIFTHVDSEKIGWISLGMLRFPPILKPVIRDRFPKCSLITGELFPGSDGKMRYLKNIRRSVYKKIISWILNYDPQSFIYFCMENKIMWQKTFGWYPKDDAHLDVMFTNRLKKIKVLD